MKKTLLVLSAILALSLAFVGCKKSSGSNNGEPDGSDPVNGGNTTTEVTEKVFAEKAEGFDNCSAIALYADLKEVSDAHPDATFIIVVKNTSGASRTGWGCGLIWTSKDPNDAYGTKDKELISDYKPTGLANNNETEKIVLKLSDVMAAIEEGGCVSYNLYNGIVVTKAYAKW